MISISEFQLFDPQKMTDSVLPNKSGNYIIVLRNSSLLPANPQIPVVPHLSFLNYKGEKMKVIYVGKSSKSLRCRDYRQHFNGTAGNSTIRKSIGCLMGFQLIPRDINSPQNGKTKFNENDEEALTKWMLRNLLLFYHANNEYTAIEKELIKTYNPPLNLQGNSNKINWEFRKGLSALRSRTTQNVVYHNQEKPDITFSNSKHTYCPNCGISLVITDDLEKEEYVKCLTCGSILLNPVYAQIKKNKERRQWKVILIIIGIAFLFNLLARLGSTSNGNNIGNKNGPTQTEAMAGVRTYLKHYYLKDPDSYHGISWEAFGSYNKQNNTYFPLHKYRAKNSFGGYVVEEKMFVLDSDGNVIKVIDDINDLINDN